MVRIRVAPLLLIAACGGTEMPTGDDTVIADAAPREDAPPDASTAPPAQFMSAVIDGVARTTESALLYNGGSFPIAVLGTFGAGDILSLHLDGAEGTFQCAYTYTFMQYRPAGATISFAFDDEDPATDCTITVTDFEPTIDGWMVGTFAGTLIRGGETMTIEDGAFSAYWP